MTKTVMLELPDELSEALESMAAAQGRSLQNFIWNELDLMVYGVARRQLQPLTEQELREFAAERLREPRITLKAKDRNRIFEQFGGRCHHCEGQILYNEPWHIDHLVPLSKGGKNEWANYVLSCVRCNLEKAAKVLP